jgi:drug/metabolite transporter (DMT)-like permease
VLLALTVAIWAAYLVVTRSAAKRELGPAEIGLLRYAPAMLLFAPVWLRMGLKPKRTRWLHAAGVGLLGGFAFITLLSIGLRFAPVADSGVFAPSMLPLYVAVLSFLVLGERFTRTRLVGFALILVGALAVGGWEAVSNAADGAWRGHLLFLAASFCWGCYTILYRLSGMTPMEAGAVMALWSSFAFGAWALVAGVRFGAHEWQFLAFQVLMQGVLSGFVASFTYGYVVNVLGTSPAAASAALVPVLAAIGGLVFLGEPVSPAKWAGIVVVAAGVALASGALRLSAPRAPRAGAPEPAPDRPRG